MSTRKKVENAERKPANLPKNIARAEHRSLNNPWVRSRRRAYALCLSCRRFDDSIEPTYVSVAGSLLVHERESFFVELLKEMVPADGLEVARSLALGELEADHSGSGSLGSWHVRRLTAPRFRPFTYGLVVSGRSRNS